MTYETLKTALLAAHEECAASMGWNAAACAAADRFEKELKALALKEGKSYLELQRGELKEVEA